MTLPFTRQPGISALLPAEPQLSPDGAMSAYPSPATPVRRRVGPGGIGAAAAGAGWFVFTVTCVPAGTAVVPPAFAVIESSPSSALYVTEVDPSAFCVTIVSNAVPRTAAVEVGVLISNFESGVLSFVTVAQVRPSVCSMVTWMPPLPRRLRPVTFPAGPGFTGRVEPAKNMRTARPAVQAF